MSTRVLTDVPDDAVSEIIADFESEGFTVTRVKQDNGLWTITAEDLIPRKIRGHP